MVESEQAMKLRDYRADLIQKLKDPDYAAEYLAQVLEEKDQAAFMIALKDVVDAGGGISAISRRAGLTRPSLYKALSQKGNPTLETLRAILELLGLSMTITRASAA
jgi:probable addiction module antidote protein